MKFIPRDPKAEWPEECHECHAVVDLVRFGEEPSYDYDTVYICKTCLEAAVTLLNQHEGKP